MYLAEHVFVIVYVVSPEQFMCMLFVTLEPHRGHNMFFFCFVLLFFVDVDGTANSLWLILAGFSFFFNHVQSCILLILHCPLSNTLNNSNNNNEVQHTI